MKQKGFVPILILIVILGIGAIAASYFAGSKGMFNKLPIPILSPTSVASPQPSAADSTANWKTYTNSTENFSFKYPSTWTIDTNGEKGDERSENIQIKLTKGQAKIQIWANMVGIGGVGQNYQGTPVNFAGTSLYRYKVIGADDKTVIIGLTDQLTESLGIFQINKKTYSFSLEYPKTLAQTQTQQLEKEFDQILSTFKFLGNETGLPTCRADFPVDAGPELTASENYSRQCTIQTTEAGCKSVDNYNAKTKDFSKPDGIPDCIYGNE